MYEVIAILGTLLACFCSFFAGKLIEERKVLKDEVDTITKGNAAGDDAVRAFKLRTKK